ncbi:hypothetical protein FNV43_RR16282 [Rhamnella rubrinervis]|uniref:non-specific serine/threonine protein kinase n=1 Tax=Rhamnella rubrinervis TaxID=2594499 RepID=A0A8K0GYH5_9ROSA|nr:hypothetical protein FNV43_RR16282 [Rhamnella rubrinervis]
MGFVFSTYKIVEFLVFGFLALNCFSNGFGSHAQLLPEDEVQTLQTISDKLQNTFWKNISRNSCITRTEDLNVTIAGDDIISNITCNCSFSNGTVCHIKTIWLKGLNLAGVLPAEFGSLAFLEELDLTRNYLSGPIPTTFRAPLRKLSLLGNRLNGSIPKEIGNITTLEELVLEDNLLEGPLHPNLGSLSNLDRLLLSGNNFTGSIPPEFGNLKNLTDFRIDGSRISGRIPSFIGNWTKLDRLDLQGTSMEGPFPSSLSLLEDLTQLRISDLSGSSMPFPNLTDLKKLRRLILRNCLINDAIPDHIGEITSLKTLDLSFNKLTGAIPETFQNLDLDHMFLTNNSLTGNLPSWMENKDKDFDLSYNNFTGPAQASCNTLRVNRISSYLPSESNSWCLKRDLPCSRKPKHYSLFINCGGRSLEYDDNKYEEDINPGGISHFLSVSEKWAFSTTGVFTGNEQADNLATNKFSLNMTGPEYYQTARLSPLSLKYYGLCLQKGSYKVQLHFAEIMFTDNQTYSSLGKRIFDVSVQGKVFLEDFNIMEEAGGAGKGITKTLDNVLVNGSTIEIHLYWRGKGTAAIPVRGVYGPLISAITITPNFKVDTGGLSTLAIVGIVAASCVLLLLILISLRLMGYLGGKDNEDPELRGLDLQTGYFTLRQIKAATGNFDPGNKIGEGGFGPVYKGVLSDGAVLAVKQLSSKSKQGNREFVNEIGMISALQHPNLVKLFGCCIEGNQLLLIYEYMENNSLARALFGREEQRLHLDWPRRQKICLGLAKGLAYLHEESRLKIVHRDIKATNVLLDKDLNAKISDFGLAKLDEEENTHISTRIAGTIGYMAPEYAMRGYLTDKADVYSFGIVALEIVSGKSNTNYRPKEEFVYLLDWAYVLQEQGNLLELVDPSLDSNYSKKEAMTMLNIALLCTNPSPTLRPPMSSVVRMLESEIPVQAPIVKRSSADPDARFKAFEMLSQDSQTQVSSFSQDSRQRGTSTDGPWIDSSISLQSNDSHENSSSAKLLKDLYNVNLD